MQKETMIRKLAAVKALAENGVGGEKETARNLTEVLDDSKPQERSRGMAAGQDILKRCGYILLGEKYGISEGMKEEITLAALKGLTMLYEKDGILYYAGTEKEAISN